MNVMTIVGRLGNDATLRNAGDTPVSNFSVACDVGYGDNKETLWVRCALWGKRGNALNQYLLKGTPVTVVGEARLRSWTNNSGEMKTDLELNVSEVSLQGRPPEGQAAPQQQSHPEAAPAQQGTPDLTDDSLDDDIPF